MDYIALACCFTKHVCGCYVRHSSNALCVKTCMLSHWHVLPKPLALGVLAGWAWTEIASQWHNTVHDRPPPQALRSKAILTLPSACRLQYHWKSFFFHCPFLPFSSAEFEKWKDCLVFGTVTCGSLSLLGIEVWLQVLLVFRAWEGVKALRENLL